MLFVPKSPSSSRQLSPPVLQYTGESGNKTRETASDGETSEMNNRGEDVGSAENPDHLEGTQGRGHFRDEGDLTNSVEALRDVRCLIDSMDNELMPVVNQIRNRTDQKVAFTELWYLFKPGDIFYSPLSNKTENGTAIMVENRQGMAPRRPGDRFQEAWQILYTSEGRPDLSARGEEDDADKVFHIVGKKKDMFWIGTYNVEFTGSGKFGPKSYLFRLDEFDGRQEITSLPVYPLQYAPNAV